MDLRLSARSGFATIGSAYSSILFTANPLLGWALLAATFVRPVSGFAGLLSVVTASLTARTLGYRADAVRSGQYGFNALLIGLAFTVGRGLDVSTVVLCILGALASVLLTAFTADLLHRGLGLCPPLVLPFAAIATVALPGLHQASTTTLIPDAVVFGQGLLA